MPIVNTKAKVSRIEDSTTVGDGADKKNRRVIYLTDATGSLKVVFWREMASSKLSFGEGDVLEIHNLTLSTWNGNNSGNVSMDTTFTKIEEEMQVTQAVLPKQVNVVSTITNIHALRDYSITTKCIHCKVPQDVNPATNIGRCTNC